MKKIILLLVVFGAASLRAQFLAPDAPIREDAAAQSYNSARLAALTATYYKRPFNVIRYNLYMDWRNPLSTMSVIYPGVNTITLVSDSAGLRSVLLDAAGMRIDSVRANGVSVAPVQPDTNEQINVPLDKSHNIGDTITLVINYTHTSTNQQGFYLYDKGVGGYFKNDTVAERIAYTMSEPLDAHWWMPCMDLPYDKALSEIRVAAPDSFVVSSNGILQSVTPVSGGNVFDWKENEPIATYLMCASSSIFSHWQADYVRVTNPADTVPILYYVWPVDSTSTDTSGAAYNATFAFRNIPMIMKGYSERYGEFPFSKYGMTAVEPFFYGGMEHQTITTIHRSWLQGTTGAEQGMAHEMTHQWFGDDITCATWKDIWLNEGFATFGESIFHEFMFGEADYRNDVMRKVGSYFSESPRDIAIYDPIGQGASLFNHATTYLKGGIVLYMLRCMIGDSAYFNAMHYYLTKFHFSAATTDDFADAMSEATGQDLHWFVNEWVYGKLQPLYNTVWWMKGVPFNTWDVHVQINQPDTARQLFKMPVPLRLFKGTTVLDTVVMDSLRSQEFVISMPYPIDSLEFDPDYHVLRDPSSTLTSVTTSMAPVSPGIAIHVAPNPARENAMLLYDIPGESRATLQISDMLGRIVARFSLGAQRQGVEEWNVQSVPAGVYYARLAGARGAATAQIEVMK